MIFKTKMNKIKKNWLIFYHFKITKKLSDI